MSVWLHFVKQWKSSWYLWGWKLWWRWVAEVQKREDLRRGGLMIVACQTRHSEFHTLVIYRDSHQTISRVSWDFNRRKTQWKSVLHVKAQNRLAKAAVTPNTFLTWNKNVYPGSACQMEACTRHRTSLCLFVSVNGCLFRALIQQVVLIRIFTKLKSIGFSWKTDVQFHALCFSD